MHSYSVINFGCASGKAGGRSLSPESVKSLGSVNVCAIKKKDGTAVYYKRPEADKREHEEKQKKYEGKLEAEKEKIWNTKDEKKLSSSSLKVQLLKKKIETLASKIKKSPRSFDLAKSALEEAGGDNVEKNKQVRQALAYAKEDIRALGAEFMRRHPAQDKLPNELRKRMNKAVQVKKRNIELGEMGERPDYAAEKNAIAKIREFGTRIPKPVPEVKTKPTRQSSLVPEQHKPLEREKQSRVVAKSVAMAKNEVAEYEKKYQDSHPAQQVPKAFKDMLEAAYEIKKKNIVDGAKGNRPNYAAERAAMIEVKKFFPKTVEQSGIPLEKMSSTKSHTPINPNVRRVEKTPEEPEEKSAVQPKAQPTTEAQGAFSREKQWNAQIGELLGLTPKKGRK